MFLFKSQVQGPAAQRSFHAVFVLSLSGLDMCVYMARSHVFPIFSLRCLVWCSYLCLIVNVVLYVSSGS